jgi:hypothetical protein
LPVLAQKTIKGAVLDAETNKPIPGASVFLSNTSIGTTADGAGRFELSIPNGRYDLIISSIGYETLTESVLSSTLKDFITIKLKSRAQEMETVIVEPFEKNGWEKWGKFFLESFIGTSSIANDCKILNPEVIKFRNSKQNNELTAVAYAPLMIENKALGYRIKYQLETFSYNFKTTYLLYAGHPLFEEMKGGKAKQKRWQRNRSEVYHGSLMHFMRSVFRNTLAQEGFEIRPVKKIPNYEKQRVSQLYKQAIKREKTADGTVMIRNTIENKDTLNYYEKVLHQSDYFDMAGPVYSSADSIADAIDSTTAELAFNDYLMVVYKKGTTPPEYQQSFPKNSTAMMSQIVLIHQRPVQVQANGSYYDPIDLMINSGYWIWSEKVGTMLPFDYVSYEEGKSK